MPTFISQAVTSLAVAVVTAVLTVQLSLRRFQSERWWDRKADAYSKIIEALHHVVAYSSMVLKDIESGEYRKEYKEEMVEPYRKAIRELEIATGIGAYVISDEVAKILGELASRPDYEEPGDTYGNVGRDYDDYQKALTKIRELAKKDLKVR
jgi:hypothetical protein